MKTKMLIVGIVLAALLVTVSSVSAVTLFSDDFEGGNLNKWTIDDPCETDVYIYSRVGGGHAVAIEDDAAIRAKINTQGYSNIQLAYERRTHSLKIHENFDIGWRVGNAGGWTRLERIWGNVNWASKTWTLPLEAENKPEIQIRFFLNDDEQDWGLVDNVVVTGDVAGCSEQRIEDFLNETYGSYDNGCWGFTTDETFYATEGTSPSYTATAKVVCANCGYTNPTGWYNVATQTQYQLWADPINPIEGDTQTFNPGGAGVNFGFYINAKSPTGPTYYTQTDLNPIEPDSAGTQRVHAKVYEITYNTNCEAAAEYADYVVAFEDKTWASWQGNDCEPDYNDVVIELRDTSNVPVPEFATIAIPAVAVLGLFLYFNRRKQRKE